MALQELVGREVQPSPAGWRYVLRFIGTAYADMPKTGSTFSGLSLSQAVAHSNDPVCTGHSPINNRHYPGRFFCIAVFEASRLRTEIGTK